MKIAIIGSGYVGFETGKFFLEQGEGVIFCDKNPERVKEIQRQGYKATEKTSEAVMNSDACFICVPTPSNEDGIDLTEIRDSAEKIGKALRGRNDYYLVVVKSTVTPGTCSNVVKPILENESGRKVGEDIGLCANPSFITEFHRSWTDDMNFEKNVYTEPYIVIGESDAKAGDMLEGLYRPLKKSVFRLDFETAEFLKYARNCMLASKTSFWNEMFLICEKLGLDSRKIAEIASLDLAIGKYGSVHGKAFGGKCLPKDLRAFIAFAKKYCEPRLLEEVDGLNEKMKKKYGARE